MTELKQARGELLAFTRDGYHAALMSERFRVSERFRALLAEWKIADQAARRCASLAER